MDRPPSSLDPSNYRDDLRIPAHIRYGASSCLYQRLLSAYGEEATQKICLVNNGRAPLTIRINPLKASRDKLLRSLSKQFKVSPCLHSPLGFYFHEKVNLPSIPEFKEGLFEIQDEASQLGSALIKAQPKQHILDYCAGSGGKSLAFSHLLNNSGQIYLYDVRSFALKKARLRFDRAGIQNVQFTLPKNRKGKMDWVVVDVPCSGTGTFRRNPDLKWKFERVGLKTLQKKQREIFKNAFSYLHSNGTIVYMTCSILPEENEEQLLYFQNEFGLKVIEKFQTLPIENGMDGFFAVSLNTEVN